MKIDLLYSEGCPNYRPALERVKQVLMEEGLPAVVREVKIPDHAAVQAHEFLGSPTIRFNSLDVEPSARSSKEYSMACRLYITDEGTCGVPSKGLIRAALREALASAGDGQAP